MYTRFPGGSQRFDMQILLAVVELGIVGIAALIVFAGGAAVAKSQRAESGRRQRMYDEVDDEDEPRRRRRRDEPDDVEDWDDRPAVEDRRGRDAEPDVAIKADQRASFTPVAPVPPANTNECPSCKSRLQITQQLVGKQIRCPNCQNVFRATLPG